MNRRDLLVAGSASVVFGASGCIDGFQGSEPEEEDTGSEADGDTSPEVDDGTDTSPEADGEPEEDFIPIEEIRDAACTPLLDDEEALEYTSEEYEHAHDVFPAGAEDEENPPFAFISTYAEAESRLNPELKADVWSFVEGIDFDERVLLVWDGAWTNTSQDSEVAGVTRPDTDTVHAHVCQYGSAGGNSHREYVYLISVPVSREPQRAKLTFREASGHLEENGISTREETYESRSA